MASLQPIIYLAKAAEALPQDPTNLYVESLYNNIAIASGIITKVFPPIGFILMCNKKNSRESLVCLQYWPTNSTTQLALFL